MKTETVGELLRREQAWKDLCDISKALNIAGDLFADRPMQRTAKTLNGLIRQIANLEVEKCRKEG